LAAAPDIVVPQVELLLMAMAGPSYLAWFPHIARRSIALSR
jgi:hypothetical protein